MSERPKDLFGIDRSQPLPLLSDEALARHREEMRAGYKRLLVDYDRREWGPEGPKLGGG